MSQLLIIIPAYNEEENIERVVEQLALACPEHDFVVVNDGSSDRTAAICEARGYPLLSLPVNLGLAGAFQTGLKYAWTNGYDYALQFDADGQHLPEYIAPMLDAAQGADIVIGSRFLGARKPLNLRMAGSALISAAIRLTTGCRIKDPTSGMRMFNRRMIGLCATQLNHGPEPDTVSYLIKKCGARVCEVPVHMAERIAGKSYLSLSRSIQYMGRMILSILLLQQFRKGCPPSPGEEGESQ